MNGKRRCWEKVVLGLLVAVSLGGAASVVRAESVGQAQAEPSLYTRLGGYDAIAAVVDDLVRRLAHDPKLGRFWANRGADGIRREKQLVINFIVDRAGGPLTYTGRDMLTTHKGMKITGADWNIFMGHLNETLDKFKVPARERQDVIGFMESLKGTVID